MKQTNTKTQCLFHFVNFRETILQNVDRLVSSVMKQIRSHAITYEGRLGLWVEK